MSYVQGEDRRQAALLPAAIEDYVAADAPVRMIDAFVDGLDVRGLGFVAIGAGSDRPASLRSAGPAEALCLWLPQPSALVAPAGARCSDRGDMPSRQWALSTQLSSAVASLPLTENSEHEDRVGLLDVAVQSYVATGSGSDDQLPRVCGYGSSNKRIVLEYVDSLNDFSDTARRIFNSVLREMIEDAIDVMLDLRSQLDPGHPQRASFLATGRATDFPAIRSSR